MQKSPCGHMSENALLVVDKVYVIGAQDQIQSHNNDWSVRKTPVLLYAHLVTHPW